MGLIVHVDGGARGNPGPAGAGVVIQSDDGNLIHEGAYFLGQQTNNAAEYHALIRALQRVTRCGEPTVTVRSDSELLVRQIIGEYRVKSGNLAQLFHQVQLLLLRIPCWRIQHIPREENSRADELANLAIDQQRDVVVVEVDADEQAVPAPPTDASAADDEPAVIPPLGGSAAPAEHGATKVAGGALPTAEPPRTVRVTLAKAPRPDGCPAGQFPTEPFVVTSTLPTGLCVHAAHALLPTIIAVLNTEVTEFAAVPTLTVRCMHAGCGATFHVAPVLSSNGVGKRGTGS